MSQLNLTRQVSTPATPTTDRVRVYVGADGLLKSVDDSGTVTAYNSSAVDSTSTASTSLISTTSTSYVLMTGMTLTPILGTYLVFARASVSATSNNRAINVAIYAGGAINANSAVTGFIRTGNATFTAADISAMPTTAVVTVDGSQAIELMWKTDGGTAQSQGFALDIIKVG